MSISIDPTTMGVGGNSTTRYVSVTKNNIGGWWVDNSNSGDPTPDWVSVSPYYGGSGTGVDTSYVNISTNTSEDTREGTLWFNYLAEGYIPVHNAASLVVTQGVAEPGFVSRNAFNQVTLSGTDRIARYVTAWYRISRNLDDVWGEDEEETGNEHWADLDKYFDPKDVDPEWTARTTRNPSGNGIFMVVPHRMWYEPSWWGQPASWDYQYSQAPHAVGYDSIIAAEEGNEEMANTIKVSRNKSYIIRSTSFDLYAYRIA